MIAVMVSPGSSIVTGANRIKCQLANIHQCNITLICREQALPNADKRITAYIVESENFESIHNHSAYALIEKNMTS